MALQTFKQWFHLKPDLLDTVSKLCPLFQPIGPFLHSTTLLLYRQPFCSSPSPWSQLHERSRGGNPEKAEEGCWEKTRWEARDGKEKAAPVADAMERRARWRLQRRRGSGRWWAASGISCRLLSEVVLGKTGGMAEEWLGREWTRSVCRPVADQRRGKENTPGQNPGETFIMGNREHCYGRRWDKTIGWRKEIHTPSKGKKSNINKFGKQIKNIEGFSFFLN